MWYLLLLSAGHIVESPGPGCFVPPLPSGAVTPPLLRHVKLKLIILDSTSRHDFMRSLPKTVNRLRQGFYDVYEFFRHSSVMWGTPNNVPAIIKGCNDWKGRGGVLCDKHKALHALVPLQQNYSRSRPLFGTIATKDESVEWCFNQALTNAKYFACHLNQNHGGTVKGLVRYDKHFASLITEVMRPDTLLVFVGDHGKYYGPIYEHMYGRFESANPVLIMVAGAKVFTAHEWAILRHNQHKFTTHFDLHYTLAKVLTGSAPLLPRYAMLLHHSRVKDRSCAEAHVHDTFCSCQQNVSVPPLELLEKRWKGPIANTLSKWTGAGTGDCRSVVPDDVTVTGARGGNNIELFVAVLHAQFTVRVQKTILTRNQTLPDITRLDRFDKEPCLKTFKSGAMPVMRHRTDGWMTRWCLCK